MFRHSLGIVLLLLLSAGNVAAQAVQGVLRGPAPRFIYLRACRGQQCLPVDSARIGADGRFAFKPPADTPGLFELAFADSDRVDLLLDGKEPLVVMEFGGRPLNEHIQVRTSDENMRLVELHAVTREAQAVRTAAYYAKASLQPTDYVALAEQDSISNRAERERADHVQRLIAGAPDSYFARLTRADADLAAVTGQGPMAVSTAFDFSDPGLMHSPIYDQAVMTFLRNVNAVHEDQFMVASDTLMVLAGRDPACQAYMLEHLLDLFSTYGPDRAAQYLLDRYVVQAKMPIALPPTLRTRVDEMLKVSVGATGADLTLNDNGKAFLLSQEAKIHRYTLLFFYSSTCEHCHGEMPRLKELYQEYAQKGLAIVGLALDPDSADFESRIRESGITWPCYSEFIGWGAKSAKAYQVKATPAFYLLDPQLHIVAKPYDAAELGRLLPGFLP